MSRARFVPLVGLAVFACGEPPVDRILVDPVPVILTLDHDSVLVMEGTSFQLSATLRDSSGIPLEGAVSWLSWPPDIATVDRDGLVQAHRMGVALVFVRSGELADTALIDVRVQFRLVSAGQAHTCATTATGSVYCWGLNTEGRLGDGTMETSPRPTRVTGDTRFSGLSAGRQFTCGVSDGHVHCWGSNRSGQLGSDSKDDALIPVPVKGNLAFGSVSAYAIHTCAIETHDEHAYCWGADWAGQLGNGDADWALGPHAVVGGLRFVALEAGWLFTCGVTPDGEAYCWGGNDQGQLGRADSPDHCQFLSGRALPCAIAPRPVMGSHVFEAVAAGTGHVCALTDDGTAYCWGDNAAGQLGVGSTAPTSEPTAVTGVGPLRSLSAGDEHTCGLTTDGVAYCWGANADGALGTSATFESCGGRLCSTTPVPVSGGHRFTLVSASRGDGGAHTCGITTTGVLLCWGRNEWGQLGIGFRGAVSFEPLRVVGQP